VVQIKTYGGLVLDVEGASKGDGARVIQWTPNGGSNQRWRFVRVGEHHQIRSVNSDKCLTVALDGSSRVVQWVCNPSRASQQWDVEPGTFSSTVMSGLTIRSVSTKLPLTATDVLGQQVSVKYSMLGDDPEQVFDFTR
jgi:hypothetical protein